MHWVLSAKLNNLSMQGLELEFLAFPNILGRRSQKLNGSNTSRSRDQFPMPIKSVHITNYYHKKSGGIRISYNNLLAAAERHKRYVRLIVPGETEAIEDTNEFARIYYVLAKPPPIFDKRYRIIMP